MGHSERSTESDQLQAFCHGFVDKIRRYQVPAGPTTWHLYRTTLVVEHKFMEEKEVQEMAWQMWSKEKGMKTKMRKVSKPKITANPKITTEPEIPVSGPGTQEGL